MKKGLLNLKSLSALSSLGAIALVNQNYVQKDVEKFGVKQENDNLKTNKEKVKEPASENGFSESKILDSYLGRSRPTKSLKSWLKSPDGIKTFNDWTKSSRGKNALKQTFSISRYYENALNQYLKTRRSKASWSKLQEGTDSYNLWRTSRLGLEQLKPLYKASSTFTTKASEWVARSSSKRSKSQWLNSDESNTYYQNWVQSAKGSSTLKPLWKQTQNYQNAKDKWINLEKKPAKSVWLTQSHSQPYYIAWRNSANGKTTTTNEWKKTSDYQNEKTKWINLKPKISKDDWLLSKYSTSAYHSWRKSRGVINVLINDFKTTSSYQTALNRWLNLKPKRSKTEWLQTNEWFFKYHTWRKTAPAKAALKTAYKKTSEYKNSFSNWKNQEVQKMSFEAWLTDPASQPYFQKYLKSKDGDYTLRREYRSSWKHNLNLKKYLLGAKKRDFATWGKTVDSLIKYDSWFVDKEASDFASFYTQSDEYKKDLEVYLKKSPPRYSKYDWFDDETKYYEPYFKTWKDSKNEKTNQWFKEQYRSGFKLSWWSLNNPQYAFYWQKDVPEWIRVEKSKKLKPSIWLYSHRGDQPFLDWAKTNGGHQELLSRWKQTKDYQDKKTNYKTLNWKQKRPKSDWIKLDAGLAQGQKWLGSLPYKKRVDLFMANYKASDAYQKDLKSYLDSSPKKRTKNQWSQIPESKSSYQNWKRNLANDDKLITAYQNHPDYKTDSQRWVNDQKAKKTYSWWLSSKLFTPAYEKWSSQGEGAKFLKDYFEQRPDYEGIKNKWFKSTPDNEQTNYQAFLKSGKYRNFAWWYKNRPTPTEQDQMKKQYFASNKFAQKFQTYKTNLDNTKQSLYNNFGINQFTNHPSGSYVSQFLDNHQFNNNIIKAKYFASQKKNNDYQTWFNNKYPNLKRTKQNDQTWLSTDYFDRQLKQFVNNPDHTQLLSQSYLASDLAKVQFNNWKANLWAKDGAKLKNYIQSWTGSQADATYDTWVDSLKTFTPYVWDEFKLSRPYAIAKVQYQKDETAVKRDKATWFTLDDFTTSFNHWQNSKVGDLQLKTKWKETDDFKQKQKAYVSQKNNFDFKYYVNNVVDWSKYTNWKTQNRDHIKNFWINHKTDFDYEYTKWKFDYSYTKTKWLNQSVSSNYYQAWLEDEASDEVKNDWFQSNEFKTLKQEYASKNIYQFEQWIKSPEALHKYYDWIKNSQNKNKVISWWKNAQTLTDEGYKKFWTTFNSKIEKKVSSYLPNNQKYEQQSINLTYDKKFNVFLQKHLNPQHNTLEKWVKNTNHNDGYLNFLRQVPKYSDMDEYDEFFTYWKQYIKRGGGDKWFNGQYPDLDTKEKFLNASVGKNAFITHLKKLFQTKSSLLQTSLHNYYQFKHSKEAKDLTLFKWDFDLWQEFVTEVRTWLENGRTSTLDLSLDAIYEDFVSQSLSQAYLQFKSDKFFAQSDQEVAQYFAAWGQQATDQEIKSYYITTDRCKADYNSFLKNAYQKSSIFNIDYQTWKTAIKNWRPHLLAQTYDEALAAAKPKVKNLSFEEWYNTKHPSFVKAWKQWITSSSLNKDVFAALWQNKNYQSDSLNIDLTKDEFKTLDVKEYAKRWEKWQTQNDNVYTHQQWMEESGGFINALWKWIDGSQDSDNKGLRESKKLYYASSKFQEDASKWVAQGPKKEGFESWYDREHKKKAFIKWISGNAKVQPNFDPMYAKWEQSPEFLLARQTHIRKTKKAASVYKKGYIPYEVEFLKWNIIYENTGEFYEQTFEDQYQEEYQNWKDPNVRTIESYKEDKTTFVVNLKESQWDHIESLIKLFQDEVNSWKNGKKEGLYWTSYWEFKHRPYFLYVKKQDHEYYNYFKKEANFKKTDEYDFHFEKWYRNPSNSAPVFFQTQAAKDAYQKWQSPIEISEIEKFKKDENKHQELALKWASIWTNGFDKWSSLKVARQIYNKYVAHGFTKWHQEKLAQTTKYQRAFAKWHQEQVATLGGSLFSKYKQLYVNYPKSNNDYNLWLQTQPKNEQSTFIQTPEFEAKLDEWMETDSLWKDKDLKINYKKVLNWKKVLLKNELVQNYLDWNQVNVNTKENYLKPGNVQFEKDFADFKTNQKTIIVDWFKASVNVDQYYNQWQDPLAPSANDFDHSQKFLEVGKQYLKDLSGEDKLAIKPYFAESKIVQDAFLSKIEDKSFLYLKTDEYQKNYQKWLVSKEAKDWYASHQVSDQEYENYLHTLEENINGFANWVNANVNFKEFFKSLSHLEKAAYWANHGKTNYDTQFNAWFTTSKTLDFYKSQFALWSDFVSLTNKDALIMFEGIYLNSDYLKKAHLNWKVKLLNENNQDLWYQSDKYLKIFGDWKKMWGKGIFKTDYFKRNFAKESYQNWRKNQMEQYLHSRFLVESKQSVYDWRDRNNNGFNVYLQDETSSTDYNNWKDPLIHTETSFQASSQIRTAFLAYKIPLDVVADEYGKESQSDQDYASWTDPQSWTVYDYDDLTRNTQSQNDFTSWYTQNKQSLKTIMFDNDEYKPYYESWDDPSIVGDDPDVDTTPDKQNRDKIIKNYEKSQEYGQNLKKYRQGNSDLSWYKDFSPQSTIDYNNWVDPNVHTAEKYHQTDEFKTKLQTWFSKEENSHYVYLQTDQARKDYDNWKDPKKLTERHYARYQFDKDYQEWLKTPDAKFYYEKLGTAKADYASYEPPRSRDETSYEKTTEFANQLKAWVEDPSNGKAEYSGDAQSNQDYQNWDDRAKHTKTDFDNNYKNALYKAIEEYYKIKNNGIELFSDAQYSDDAYNNWQDPNAHTQKQYDGNVGGEFNKDLNAWLIKDEYANLIKVYQNHLDSQTDLDGWWDNHKRTEADYLLSQIFNQDYQKWSITKSNGVNAYNLDDQSLTDYNAWTDPLVHTNVKYELSAQFNMDLNLWTTLPNQLAFNKYLSLPKSTTDYNNWNDPLERSKSDFENNRDGVYWKTYEEWLLTKSGKEDALFIFKQDPYALSEFGKWKGF